jgi:hypothetical protein
MTAVGQSRHTNTITVSTNVRFAPKADKQGDVSESPLWAKTGLMHRSKQHPYSIISSASAMSLSVR